MNRKEFIELANEGFDQTSVKIRSKALQEQRKVLIKSASAFVIRVASLLKDNGFGDMDFFIPQRPQMSQYRFTWADIRLRKSATRIFCIGDYKTFGNDIQLNKDIVTLVFGGGNCAIVTEVEADEEIMEKCAKPLSLKKHGKP